MINMEHKTKRRGWMFEHPLQAHVFLRFLIVPSIDLGSSWGSFWGHLGGRVSHLGTYLSHLGNPWGALGASLKPSWRLLSHLEASWLIWRPPRLDFLDHFGTIWMSICSFKDFYLLPTIQCRPIRFRDFVSWCRLCTTM